MSRTSALVADDEPLLRERLAAHLSRLWPDLHIVAHARNGRETVELFEHHQPQIVFLDIHMPGQSGIDAARSIARRAHIVFVTADEHYAVQAFEQGAIDYLVKPFDEQRLTDTVQRLQQRVASHPDARGEALDAVIQQLSLQLQQRGPVRERLQWIKASVGSSVKLIAVEDVAYFRADEKYTLVVWRGGEALIRKSIRELVDELDADRFAQVHRSVIVNLHEVAQVHRAANETAEIQLKERSERLPVSRSFVHLFRQM